MKVIRLAEIANAGREVYCPKGGFISFRFLLAADGMGFSLHKTVVPPGGPQHWHYKNHLEACYCVSGRGLLTNLRTGQYWAINPDTVYALDDHDDHTLEAIEETVLISVFNPPVVGAEVHDAEGSYPNE